MKHIYIFLILFSLSLFTNAQGYELGIVHTSGTSFKIVAIPDFASAGNTDVSDIGFTLILPAGSNDIINHASLLTGRTWTVQQFDATFLTGQGLGDGTKDAFLFNNPPGQSLISHNSGDQIDLVSFEVSNMPNTGSIEFLLNSDPIAIGAGGVLNSFYNSNINATSTQDYFSGIDAVLSNFMFSTLSVDNIEISNIEVSLSPNPATDIVRILTPENIADFKVEIYDSLGKQVLLNLSEENTINVSKLSTGLYMVSIITDQAKVTKKLVVN